VLAFWRSPCNFVSVTLASLLFTSDVPDDAHSPSPPGIARRRTEGIAACHEASNVADAQVTDTNVTEGGARHDQILVAAVRAGDGAAFETVYLEHFSDLLDFAATLVRDRDGAEDVVQQVFAEVWRGHAAWEPHRIRPALFRAVRNRAINVLRRSRSHDDPDLVQTLVAPVSTNAPAEFQELEHALAQALARLPERRRTALLLRVVRQMSYAEIGNVLDVSEKGAFVLVSRAREALEPVRQRFLER
jgi:RNA polymerase sigma factor (sigma-70 family)